MLGRYYLGRIILGGEQGVDLLIGHQPAQHLQHLFDLFTRHARLRFQGQGAGRDLGLSERRRLGFYGAR